MFQDWLKLLWEILDFILKAAGNYAATPEGQKEFGDILEAYEGLGGDADFDPDSVGVMPAREVKYK